MHKYKETIKNWLTQVPKIVPDVLALGGTISISYGFYKLMEPLGFIVMGVLLIACAVIWSKS